MNETAAIEAETSALYYWAETRLLRPSKGVGPC